MIIRRLAISLALSLMLALTSILSPALASEDSKSEEVKCKKMKLLAQSPKKINPPTALLKRGPRNITLQTNCGNIGIRVYYRQAPVTLTVLTSLINSGYFNRTHCHRLTTDRMYVVQCGDPTGTGMGDPGFRYKDENLPEGGLNNYPRGTVAMANSGAPATNGSQFFLVYRDTTLGPNYTIWGEITSGIEILEFVAKSGVKGGGNDGAPLRNLIIENVIVR